MIERPSGILYMHTLRKEPTTKPSKRINHCILSHRFLNTSYKLCNLYSVKTSSGKEKLLLYFHSCPGFLVYSDHRRLTLSFYFLFFRHPSVKKLIENIKRKRSLSTGTKKAGPDRSFFITARKSSYRAFSLKPHFPREKKIISLI